jgi:aldehyde dehydrogenase
MDSLLKDVVRKGTATRALALKRNDLAGKTGTTNDSFDAWFAGYQPSIAAVTWVGFDQPAKLGDRETGGGLALPIWVSYMGKALKGVPDQVREPPPGVVNIVNGFGKEAGEALATSTRIAKIAFTGSTPVGQRILRAAADNLIPSTVELGGKSPNIFFADVMDHDDAFLDKALEGLSMFALNQGEICTCPSRILIQESIYDRFIERALKRVSAIKQGHPLDTSTMVGAQVSQQQMERILGYIDIGRNEGVQTLTGGERNRQGGDINDGFYVKPTLLFGKNDMRVFQEEIFGPVASVTTFKDMDEAIHIANDTTFGLGAGVWSRNGNTAYKVGRAVQAGRVWTNCYHLYPAHAAFGGYKKSGIGRENHQMALNNYQQTKNLLVSYSENKLGFF